MISVERDGDVPQNCIMPHLLQGMGSNVGQASDVLGHIHGCHGGYEFLGHLRAQKTETDHQIPTQQ